MSEAQIQEKERGFSLLEMLVGTTLVVVVLGAILSMTIQHSKLGKVDAEISLALMACRNNLEYLRTVPIEDLPAMNGKGFDVLDFNGNPGGLKALPGDLDGLPGQFSVVLDKSTLDSKLYLVTATVTWTGVPKKQSLSLKTLMGARK